MDLNEYIIRNWNIWYLNLRVVPNAKQTELFSVMSDWVLKIRIKAIPEKWKANYELINFLSKNLKIKKDFFEIVSWVTDKNKVVRIDFLW